MFENVKSINKLVAKKSLEIEQEINNADSIFMDVMNGLMREINQQKADELKALASQEPTSLMPIKVSTINTMRINQ
jgi:hypothetical protein